MKISFKRVVSSVCALAMCAAMIPAAAWAEPTTLNSDPAVVEQIDDNEIETVPGTSDQPEATPEPEVTPAPTAQPEATPGTTADPETSPAPTAQPEATPAASVQPEATPGNTESAPEEPAQDSSGSVAVAEAPTVLADGPVTYADGSYTIAVGETIPLTGTWILGSKWKIDYGSAVVKVEKTGEKQAKVTGLIPGVAHVTQTGAAGVVSYASFTITVVEDKGDRAGVYLYLAKPGDYYDLPNTGDAYYYLTHGGEVSALASSLGEGESVKDLVDEERIKSYVTEWPTQLDSNTGDTGSPPVGGE